MTEHELVCAENAVRLDKFLATADIGISRSMAVTLIESGRVSVNGKPCDKKQKLSVGDRVAVTVPDPVPYEAKAENIPLEIVYEDSDLLVVNKPKGMVVHPAPGNETGTLVNALLYRFGTLSEANGPRPGIVHRIDRFTSGLLVVAKNDAAHEALSRQFAAHTAHREYVCLVHGNLKEGSGTVDAPIGRHKTDRKRMAVVENGRNAVTHWRVLERFGAETLLDVALETGRTHQIRVHMAYIKHPILGDEVYGSPAPKLGLNGQALHGYRLTFTHPKTGELLSFTAPIPEDFRHALRLLGSDMLGQNFPFLP